SRCSRRSPRARVGEDSTKAVVRIPGRHWRYALGERRQSSDVSGGSERLQIGGRTSMDGELDSVLAAAASTALAWPSVFVPCTGSAFESACLADGGGWSRSRRCQARE